MFKSSYDFISEAAIENPDKIAFVFLRNDDEIEKVTYASFFRMILGLSNFLFEITGKENPVVSYAIDNSIHAQVVLWGSQVSGIVNPINPYLSAIQISEIVNACKSDVLFLDHNYIEKKNKIEELTGKQVIIVKDDFKSLIDRNSLSQNKFGSKNEIAAYFHTGGTTGSPKIVPLSHLNSISNSEMIKAALNSNSDDVFLCGLPLFHVNAIHITSLVPFMTSSTIILPEGGFRNRNLILNFWDVVTKYRISLFSSVPTILSDLLSVPVRKEHNLSSLRYVIAGAAPLSVEVFNRFEQTTGLKILEGYGLTESTCAVSCNPISGSRKVGSIGVPFFGVDVIVANIDRENGKINRTCASNEIGHLLIKGPNVFSGYLSHNDNINVWYEGWFDTGDLGFFDEDNYLWLTGRSKDIIIRGGHNIDPRSVEEVLYKHESVKLAACVGKPDKRLGEVPVAFVATDDESLTESDIIAYLSGSNLERASIPIQVVFLKQFPLTAVGKIYKPELRLIAARN